MAGGNSDTKSIDSKVNALAEKSGAWRTTPLSKKVALIDGVLTALQDLELKGHVAWGERSVEAQCMDPSENKTAVSLECLLTISIVKGFLARLRGTIHAVATSGVAPKVTLQPLIFFLKTSCSRNIG